jgi:hypothetical protein
MRLLRPRFTVRRLMVAVAVVGVVLGIGSDLDRRRRRFLDLRSYYREKAVIHSECWTRIVSMRDYYLSRKYERAARYPWLPVAPDPPEPE